MNNSAKDDSTKTTSESKGVKLNLQAQEYKPKNYGQKTQTATTVQSNPNFNNQMVNNPYTMGYDMYNPYGGMYTGNVANMGFCNPNMMNMEYDPNIMGQNMGFNANTIPTTQNVTSPPITANVTQTTEQPPKQSGGGIVGLKDKKKKKGDDKKDVEKSGTAQSVSMQSTPVTMTTTTTVQKQPQAQAQAQPKVVKKYEKAQTSAPKDVKEKKDIQETKPVQVQAEDTLPVTIEKVKKEVEAISLAEEIELVEDSKEGAMIEVDPNRKPVTLVFIGHVDAGKSTISGSILYKTGQIDERTIEKYQKDAKANNRESWFIAYIMDINEEERERGKTVEVGKAFFETQTKRFTILDAPGHAGYVPNMLQNACQADYAGLVISAKKGEFEAGFEREGRTREHALLAKSLGVFKLIVIVNKMDDDTVRWSKERFDQIKADVSPFLKSCGYNLDKHVSWIPLSGLTSDNLIDKVDSHKCSWYDGPTLFELLDSLDMPPRGETGPVRLPILDRYKESGMHIMGKLENGILKYGGTYTIMPTGVQIEVGWLFDTEERGVPYAKPGESVRIRAKGIDNETDVTRGNVLCSPDDLCAVFSMFEAEMQLLDLPETKQIMTNGYQCVLHFHTTIEECIVDILGEIDRSTKIEKKTKFVRSQSRVRALIKTTNPVCGEKFEKYPCLGRFSLRDEGKTIAIGKILRYKPYTK